MTESTTPESAAPESATPEQPAVDTAKPRSKQFRRAYTTVRLTPDQATRQGQVATSAFHHFGGRDAAMAFLNAHDETLGGRPLDLAIASPDGLAAVEAAMQARVAA
ncbi:hypothetical protein ASG37_07510 [Sphingomonas sp. Leaf407]|uniref:DUF2384 domain-containing protein n=1 Tax=unclassified Sphingomonas TaxID=196159 RepID=UPI0006FDD7C9|nr:MULTISPECIES: DUF2384 domain-containing protein [unclassified Sphingomonas]KQN39411.1 hypothetical protein ASE97_04800 [Sphingomonas sp. Leaf42]KQT28687.1 hypothetical protein ASG37_07510 [Sphingomonas sp. Leaf407]